MQRKLLLVCLLNITFVIFTSGQVKIRLFSSRAPESAVFSVTSGRYELIVFPGETYPVSRGETVFITRYDGHLAIKTTGQKGLICDSLTISGRTGHDFFSLRINGPAPVRQFYTGDLKCFPDLGTILMINTCDIESYIAGVVRAEGGKGRNKEYCKTQAILARTYMYRYFERHLPDGYNVCDNTHCQAFNGISGDSLLNNAAFETRGLVVLDSGRNLIISAFHSNCGGETSPPEDVWLTGMPYLKKKIDPYCISSTNAVWEKRIGLNDWTEVLKRSGYTGKTGDASVFTFFQKTRQTYYKTGAFTIPFSALRSELKLRSTFFSVIGTGDSVILRGRGYGHGVGLCQEGAMKMAEGGYTYKQIIDFYYSDVIITDIKNAVFLERNPATVTAGGGL